jgi:hypothetical protein
MPRSTTKQFLSELERSRKAGGFDTRPIRDFGE